ncbi:MAG: NAD(P)H-dependent glycerol-3-phosphate dehydrogenase [Candidatus Woesearchaeota archaeon]|nr:NAD(P)H-dependent glycerol-3-phosphate dehydrogenase [Candidatus Woesearchaeota archaeon]MDP7179716.1 NAD(P)H-dependent glycerol-3-phosphate dehydrogenase [Candidatus Woesearchaeota archaeon]
MKKISVVGAGSWGTTLAVLLGGKGYDVNLWVREKELVSEIEKERENKRFLKGVKIPSNVKAVNDLRDAVFGAELVIMSVPSQFLRDVAKQVSPYLSEGVIVVDVAKGIEAGTYKTMSQILEDELPDFVKIVALSGPNHAEEVSRKIPTATVVASKDKACLKKVKEILSTDYFKVYPHDDVVGVEVCGALKNITAIVTGICDGLGLGDNAKGSIITLGLTEMNKFGREFGAKRATCYGLAGVGDLVATCTSKHSRNRFVGEKLAEGKSFDEIKEEMHGMVAEGVKATKAVYEFGKEKGIDLPLTTQVYKVLYENKNLKEAIKDLLELI